MAIWSAILVLLLIGAFYLFAHYHGHDLHKLTVGLGGVSLMMVAFVGVVAFFVVCVVCLLELFRGRR